MIQARWTIACLSMVSAGALLVSLARAEDADLVQPHDPVRSATALARLAVAACFHNGEDQAKLAAFANTNGWHNVGAPELAKYTTADSKMTGGWTSKSDGIPFAVMQSHGYAEPPVYVCSMTAKLDPATGFNVVKHVFESSTGTTPTVSSSRPEQMIETYWLPHTADCEARVSLVQTLQNGIVTFRMLHGRKRNGSQHDDAYSAVERGLDLNSRE